MQESDIQHNKMDYRRLSGESSSQEELILHQDTWEFGEQRGARKKRSWWRNITPGAWINSGAWSGAPRTLCCTNLTRGGSSGRRRRAELEPASRDVYKMPLLNGTNTGCRRPSPERGCQLAGLQKPVCQFRAC